MILEIKHTEILAMLKNIISEDVIVKPAEIFKLSDMYVGDVNVISNIDAFTLIGFAAEDISNLARLACESANADDEAIICEIIQQMASWYLRLSDAIPMNVSSMSIKELLEYGNIIANISNFSTSMARYKQLMVAVLGEYYLNDLKTMFA